MQVKLCNNMAYISVRTFHVSSRNKQELLLRRRDRHKRSFMGAFSRLIFSSSFWICLLLVFAFLNIVKPGSVRKEEDELCVKARREERIVVPASAGLGFKDKQRSLWAQREDFGYGPCLNFSREYFEDTRRISEGNKKRPKFLMVVVSGGLNQQRNQIVDSVVIARILEAVLVVPVMQVNVIWRDDSEFSDIFDVEHFKNSLRDHVKVVSSLPSTHIMSRPAAQSRTPINASTRWIQSHYSKALNRDGVLLLRGLDSRLSRDLSPDLQKLRCKVAFEALRFAEPIEKLGNKLAERMSSKGPYMGLHLRLEKDVWVRTGCLPGLGSYFDKIVENERIAHPYLLTARSNLTFHQRKKAGLCPLNASEISRLLRALGASKRTRIYWAGGKPLGGTKALESLVKHYPEIVNKEGLASAEELAPFQNKASMLAALDYIVVLRSDIFMASHGGNMGRALQGHRTYLGRRKHITPNKRLISEIWKSNNMADNEDENDEYRRRNQMVREAHDASFLGKAIERQRGKDVIAYPLPECMCRRSPS